MSARYYPAVDPILNAETLVPAQQLAATNRSHYPNESAEYRAARVNGARYGPAGNWQKGFELISESGQTTLALLFGEKDTQMVFSMMYGPLRKAACPMCTLFLSAWNGVAVNLRERLSIAVTTRSPIERAVDFKQQRGFSNLRSRPI